MTITEKTTFDAVLSAWQGGRGIPPGLNQGQLEELLDCPEIEGHPGLKAALDGAIADAPFG